MCSICVCWARGILSGTEVCVWFHLWISMISPVGMTRLPIWVVPCVWKCVCLMPSWDYPCMCVWGGLTLWGESAHCKVHVGWKAGYELTGWKLGLRMGIISVSFSLTQSVSITHTHTQTHTDTHTHTHLHTHTHTHLHTHTCTHTHTHIHKHTQWHSLSSGKGKHEKRDRDTDEWKDRMRQR